MKMIDIESRKYTILALLSYTDNYMTIQNISEETDIPIHSVLDCCRILFSEGFVDFKKQKNKRKKQVDRGLLVRANRKGTFFVLDNFDKVFYDCSAKALRIFYLKSDKSVWERLVFVLFDKLRKR